MSITRRDELAAGIEERKRRREDLQALPLPRDDVLELLAEYAAACRRRHGAELRRNLQDALPRVMAMPEHSIGLISLTRGDLSEGTLLALFGPAVLDVLRAEIETWDWPEAGPSRAERRAEIERLDGEIDELERQLDELRREALLAGVRL
jgi:hypothetical protein